MYDKKDIGALVYYPAYIHPAIIQGVVNEGESYSNEFEVVISKPEFPVLKHMDAEGYEISSSGERTSDRPVFSRAPYVPGEPFVCVTEHPTANHHQSTQWQAIHRTVTSWDNLPNLEESDAATIADNLFWAEVGGTGFRCGSGDNRCNCNTKGDCGYVEIAKKIKDNGNLFNPKDEGITVYDQDGNEYDIHEWVPEDGVFDVRRESFSGNDVEIEMKLDGTTATALKFTRQNPKP